MDEIDIYNYQSMKFMFYCLLGALAGILGLLLAYVIDPKAITITPTKYGIFSGCLGFWILIMLLLLAKDMKWPHEVHKI